MSFDPIRDEREVFMLVSDLLHSCANECVAEAAVASIGGDFAHAVQDAAEEQGVSAGFYAAAKVRRFARIATERDWRELVDALKGEDFPVLTGLRTIVTRSEQRSPQQIEPSLRVEIAGSGLREHGRGTAAAS